MNFSRRFLFRFAGGSALLGRGAPLQAEVIPASASRAALQNMIYGLRWTQMLSVVANLGIADQLRSGPRSIQELARTTGVNQDSLYRVLRALAGHGVFAEDDGKHFRLTPSAELLRSDVPGSMRVMARVMGEDWYWKSWGALSHTVATGETGFDHVYGKNTWDWFQENPEPAALFSAFMNEVTSASTLGVMNAFDFSKYRVVADIGGGEGVLLSAVLAKAPKARGILLELPHVIAGARKRVDPQMQNRIDFVAGDFFRSVPAHADLYVLKHIVHDWNDEKARQILVSCRRAMSKEATILLVDSVVCGPNEACDAKLSDVAMMVRNGGRNRTEDEYSTLLASAGFQLRRVVPATNGLSILEASPL